jgi:DNA invertase Pin-like site-specific DNA recombinase
LPGSSIDFRDLHHLVNLVHDLTARGICLKVLAGQGAISIQRPRTVAEFERELIIERTRAGLVSARAPRSEQRPAVQDDRGEAPLGAGGTAL